jgi:hypothetical protein
MRDLSKRTKVLAASAGGVGLSGATRLVAAVRPVAKPLHPRGDVVTGRLRRSGGGPGTGSQWLDQPGTDEVLVRRSRAVGLPTGLPDIHGLAVRVPLEGGGHGDLLLATTGRGRLTRFLLTAGRTPYSRPLTTLLPYRTPSGPTLLAAVARSEHRYELAYASPQGTWHPFADLALSATAGPDPLVSFDPVLNTLPGLANYDWVRRLRGPSYGTARLTRRRDRRRGPAT